MSDLFVKEAHEIVFNCSDCKVEALTTNFFVTGELELVFVVQCPQCEIIETFLTTPATLLEIARHKAAEKEFDSWDN